MAKTSDKTITVGDATYYVLDRSKLPTGRQFPAGTIEWNTDDFKYDWQGSTSWKSGDESNVVKVGFTYQWGLGKAVEDTIALTAKNYKISRLTSMSTSKDSSAPQVSFKSERDSNGNYTTIFEIDSMSVDASTQDLVAYLNSFKYVNGKFVTESSMTATTSSGIPPNLQRQSMRLSKMEKSTSTRALTSPSRQKSAAKDSASSRR